MLKKTLLTLALTILAVSTFTSRAHAQYGSLSVGTFTVADPVPCPGSGWYHYGTQYVICKGATVSNCPNADTLSLTFGYLDPVGLVSGVSVEKGVIVLLSEHGGTAPGDDPVGITDGDFAFSDYYFKQGFEVVQLAWSSDWEYIHYPPPPPPPYGNIQYASCRPATFLNWVFNNIYAPIQQNNNSQAGMCAHAFSGGSAAAAYTMAYFGPPSGTSWW